MGHLGDDIVAANAVVVVARNFGTVVCFGIANAGAIILGKSIGCGNSDTVKADSSHFLKITALSAALGSIVIFVLRPILSEYNALYKYVLHLGTGSKHSIYMRNFPLRRRFKMGIYL